MSENEDTETVNDDGFEPITSQEALDKLIGARIDGVKKKFAGFAEYKAKAARLDELQEASKTEIERARERVTELEQQLAAERHTNIRKDVARAKGVPENMLTGANREELELSADTLIEWRKADAKEHRPARGMKSGATGSDTTMSPKEAAAAAVRRLRSH